MWEFSTRESLDDYHSLVLTILISKFTAETLRLGLRSPSPFTPLNSRKMRSKNTLFSQDDKHSASKRFDSSTTYQSLAFFYHQPGYIPARSANNLTTHGCLKSSVTDATSQNSIYQSFRQSEERTREQVPISRPSGKIAFPLSLSPSPFSFFPFSLWRATILLDTGERGALADHARIPTHLKLLTGCYARHCRLRNRPMRVRTCARSPAQLATLSFSLHLSRRVLAVLVIASAPFGSSPRAHRDRDSIAKARTTNCSFA